MRYKLLASDLDGTLNNDEGLVTDLNRKAIAGALKQGLYFVICSGRSQKSVEFFNRDLGLNQPGCFGISFNGGVVYKADTMETLFEHRLKKENAEKVVRAVKRAEPDAPIMAYVQADKIYCENAENENITGYTSRVKIERKAVENLENSLPHDVMKIIIRWDHDKLVHIYESASAALAECCDMFFSSETLLEFSPLGSNKAVGLKFLAEYLGLTMAEVAAAGDNYNDIEMVEAAGLGVAVANAVDEIKAAADFITVADNDHDAIAEIIEYIGYGQSQK